MASRGSDLSYTVPGTSTQDSSRIVAMLQLRLHALNYPHLTSKHVH